MRADIPINLPALPLPYTPPNSFGWDLTVNLIVDDFGRWGAQLSNDEGEIEDELFPYHTAQDALIAVARNYPGARFTPPDEESNE